MFLVIELKLAIFQIGQLVLISMSLDTYLLYVHIHSTLGESETLPFAHIHKLLESQNITFIHILNKFVNDMMCFERPT